MKIKRFGDPPFLEFFENGTVLSREDKTIDCAQLQEDSQVTIDICMDEMGELIFGTKDAAAYVANVIIPAKQYIEQVKCDENGAPVLDENDEEQMEKVAMPLDMGQVIGNLWTLPAQKPEAETE